MKQIAQMTLALIALVAVSACSMTPEGNAYSEYSYTPSDASDGVLVTDLMY